MTSTEHAAPERHSGEATLVATLDDLAENSLRMVTVDGRRVCLVRSGSGIHAIDNACPHQGYGLTQGALDGDVVTCEWHNWKFRVTDGACLVGEEAVQTHLVDVDDRGGVSVTINRPAPETLIPELLASLRSAIERDYIGQVARDVVRLLKAGATPADLMWEAVAYGAPRSEYGWGHTIASATDCLAMVALYEGDQRALPIVQGIAGIAETERGRQPRELPDPASGVSVSMSAFGDAVEDERLSDAQAILLGAIERGDCAKQLTPWFTSIVSNHHLSYGHGAIYSQKAFELLEMIGWERSATVLPHLVTTLVYGTREDKLPYMRPFMKELAGVDLDQLASYECDPSWADDGTLLAAILGNDRRAPVAATVAAVRGGAGIDGVLDVVVQAVSERMLRYDVEGEFEFEDDFGWLGITHGLTYAHAARWHHHQAVDAGVGTTPEAVRLALFTTFLGQWTGRHEWHTKVGDRAEVAPIAGDLETFGNELQRQAQLDGTTAFIVHAHAVKTSRAAALEALRSGSSLPLDATAHFMAAPKLERFVAATVVRSIEFLNGRTQRD